MTGLLLMGLVVLAAPTFVASVWSLGKDIRLDERDRAILAQAPASQAPAMLVLLAVWTIALQESFRDEPEVPDAFLNLASNISTLIGYRRG